MTQNSHITAKKVHGTIVLALLSLMSCDDFSSFLFNLLLKCWFRVSTVSVAHFVNIVLLKHNHLFAFVHVLFKAAFKLQWQS